ncbi:MFS transporter, PPP family, 3-phenylpropionic acid transporter [Carboxydocella sporoproducens DSM 16521]|uniref:MFS transporter, PPP family, 3-phenylpropionic acid transporter n=2 Tax=Carboxydocella TaxID=178898 RepID=A0A1T4M8Q5_9FIRM|nr:MULTISPECIES: MFS transporter [Carboxydocella]AVX20993.1 MFS transporter, PPP family, 3-phenylpropionic acid transporter [Carboxydocella thermautotrophica]SJZ63420.1 MFS transporter, PPP family, 3-phenylpropionic acid transporter [Carboxydocella sporoproducens DSM 16521]
MQYQSSLNKLYYFLLYAIIALQIPYLPLYFKEAGANGNFIGLISALGPFVGLFMQPFWGIIADKTQRLKFIIQVLLFSSGVFILLVPLYNNKIWWMLTMLLYTMVQTASMPLTDTLMLSDNQRSREFGKYRLWGSLGFAVIVLITSAFLTKSNIKFIFPLSSILFFIVWILSFSLPKTPVVPIKQNISEIFQLIKNPLFILLVVYAFIIQMPFSAYNTFFSIYFSSLGATTTMVGLAWALAASSEIPVFYLFNVLRKSLNLYQILTIAGIIYAVRWFVYAYFPYLWLILLLQLSQGLSFGLFYLSAIQLLNETTSQEVKASAQTIFTAIAWSLGAAAGSYSGGIIYTAFGLFTLFKLSALLAFLSALTWYVFTKR